MIDLSNIQYKTNRRSYRYDDMPWTEGTLAINYRVSLSDDAQIPAERIRAHIASNIWHHVYGDLIEPIKQLQMLAARLSMTGTVYDYRDEVEQLIVRINKLLMP